MAYRKQLGIFVKEPVPGAVKTRLVPPLSPEEACALHEALAADVFRRAGRLVKVSVTVFYAGATPGSLAAAMPPRAARVAQEGDDLGARLRAAFDHLLAGEGRTAVIIGSDSPDLPLPYLKRAFQRLKHHDVVLGPSVDGGYYLIGLRRALPALFEGVRWGSEAVFAQTLDAVARAGASLALLPVWYDVDDAPSLALLESLERARRLAGQPGLPAVREFLARRRSGDED
jgi:rSAM/selenodomain-associated transferase 1